MTENKTISFAFICDNEVAWILNVPLTLEPAVAAMQSNPIILEVDNSVQMGDLYVDGKFVKPQ